MRRLSACLLLSLAIAAGAAAADKAEVIVLLDTSESMFDYIDPVRDYVVKSVVQDYIALRDDFHLLTFADTAQLELSQEIAENADLRAVVARTYLLYPFGANTDLASAIDYLAQYAADLPDSNLKNIIIITDGIHNPGPASPYASRSSEEIEAAIRSSVKSMKEKGWRVSFIKIPFKADGKGMGEDGNPMDMSGALKDELGDAAADFDPTNPGTMNEAAMGLVSVTFPGDLGKRNARFALPLRLKNSSNQDVKLELVACETEYGNVLGERAFMRLRAGKADVLRARIEIPKELAAGPVSLPVRLRFAGSTRVSPSSGEITFTLSRHPVSSFFNSMAIAPTKIVLIVLIALAAIALAVIFIFLVRQAPIGSAIARIGRTEDDEERALKASMGIRAEEQRAASSRYTEGWASSAAAAGGRAVASANERFIGAKEAAGKGAGTETAGAAKKPKPGKVPASAPAITVASGSKAEKGRGASPFSFGSDAQEARLRAREEALRKKEEAAAEASGRRAAAAALRSLRVKAQGNVQVEFRVNEQTSLVGFRNIHSIKSGSRFIVGGMKSADFLVFVVKVPARLAQVFFDGEKLSFVPLRPEFFPGIEGMLDDCLDAPIKCVTPTGYEMTMSFSKWENPALKFNRLLDLIDLGGSRPR